jgi:ankyrin repeat protein
MDGFSWACEYGRAEVVALLLERGFDVRSQLRPHRQTGLHWAAFGAHVETVRVLLRHHAPIDPIDETFANTPLRWALFQWKTHPSARTHSRRYYQTAALLVGAGAHVDPAWLEDDAVKRDPRMSAALRSTSAQSNLVANRGGGVL